MSGAPAATEKPAPTTTNKPATEKPAGEKPAPTTTEKPTTEKPAAAADAAGTKPAAEKPPTEGAPSGEKPAPTTSVVPETYKLTVPENGVAYVDPEVLSTIEGLARKSGWSNEDAQNAVDEHVAAMSALSAQYLDATKADKTYGGTNLAETQRLAKLAIEKVRPQGHPRRDSFLAFLRRFAGENHIEVVSFLADLGRDYAEDSTGVGKQPAGAPKSAAEKLYDNTPAS